MLRIVVVAGGTGGHVFPAECIARQLAQDGYDVEFITDQRGLKFIKSSEIKITVQKIYSTSRFRLMCGVLKNLCINIYKFIKNRPVCVIGFGGYPSFAPVAVAQILGIKTIIHEQNAIIGRANALLAFNAKAILVAFRNTAGVFRLNPNKIKYVGNPTRFDSIYASAKRPNNSIFTILIFGGSQGATLFANVVAPAICKVGNVRVFHQARCADIETISNMYKHAGIEATVLPFFDNMSELYQKSDLVISRSGASTVFEIIGFRIPAILIPFSHSVNGDQVANAKALGNGVIVLDENNLSVDIVADTVRELINNPDKLAELSQNLPVPHIVKNDFIDAINYVVSR